MGRTRVPGAEPSDDDKTLRLPPTYTKPRTRGYRTVIRRASEDDRARAAFVEACWARLAGSFCPCYGDRAMRVKIYYGEGESWERDIPADSPEQAVDIALRDFKATFKETDPKIAHVFRNGSDEPALVIPLK